MLLFEITVLHPLKGRKKRHRATRYIVLAADETQAREAAADRSFRDVDFLVVRPIELADRPHVFDYGVVHYTPDQYETIRSHHQEITR